MTVYLKTRKFKIFVDLFRFSEIQRKNCCNKWSGVEWKGVEWSGVVLAEVALS